VIFLRSNKKTELTYFFEFVSFVCLVDFIILSAPTKISLSMAEGCSSCKDFLTLSCLNKRNNYNVFFFIYFIHKYFINLYIFFKTCLLLFFIDFDYSISYIFCQEEYPVQNEYLGQ